MAGAKPHVVYFGVTQEMVDLLTSALSQKFEVTGVTGIDQLDPALDLIRRIKPDFVLLDPNLLALDHQRLHRRLQAEPELQEIQALVVSGDTLDL